MVCNKRLKFELPRKSEKFLNVLSVNAMTTPKTIFITKRVALNALNFMTLQHATEKKKIQMCYVFCAQVTIQLTTEAAKYTNNCRQSDILASKQKFCLTACTAAVNNTTLKSQIWRFIRSSR